MPPQELCLRNMYAFAGAMPSPDVGRGKRYAFARRLRSHEPRLRTSSALAVAPRSHELCLRTCDDIAGSLLSQEICSRRRYVFARVMGAQQVYVRNSPVSQAWCIRKSDGFATITSSQWAPHSQYVCRRSNSAFVGAMRSQELCIDTPQAFAGAVYA